MTTNEKYLKNPTTYLEQVNIMKSRNLIIKDEDRAIDILKRINYYRLSAYMLTFKTKEGNYKNASLETVYNLYLFDQKLRNLLFLLLDNIEISFRTQIAYLLAHKYGAFAYRESDYFTNQRYHTKMVQNFEDEIKRSDEIFVSHHKSKYNGEFPIWVVIEVASFGALSMLYSNLLPEDKTSIALEYNLKSNYLQTWLHALSNLRNKCAHHGRLYNRKLTVTPKLFSAEKKMGIKNDTIFADIFIMGKLLNKQDEWEVFIKDLDLLIYEYEDVNLNCLGFPSNWKTILMQIK